MKKILLITILLINTACMRFNFFIPTLYKMSEAKRENKIEKIYNNLNKDYYFLLENEIKENDRENLENKFQVFSDELKKLYEKPMTKEHSDFLDRYFKEVNLKLQYLKDLK